MGTGKENLDMWFICALDSQTDIFLLNYPGYVHSATSFEIIWNFIAYFTVTFTAVSMMK